MLLLRVLRCRDAAVPSAADQEVLALRARRAEPALVTGRRGVEEEAAGVAADAPPEPALARCVNGRRDDRRANRPGEDALLLLLLRRGDVGPELVELPVCRRRGGGVGAE